MDCQSIVQKLVVEKPYILLIAIVKDHYRDPLWSCLFLCLLVVMTRKIDIMVIQLLAQIVCKLATVTNQQI